MAKLPENCTERIIGAEARKIVHYKFPAEHWEYHEETGGDFGRDCIVELIENEQFVNKKIEGQIKGTRNPKKIDSGQFFTYPMDIKTINYGLSSSTAFVLFYVSVDDETVYYLPIQDYFIANPNLFDRLDKNEKTVNVHIPINNTVSKDDFDLQQIAKSVYVDGPSRSLHKA